jgi:hypothetical protein
MLYRNLTRTFLNTTEKTLETRSIEGTPLSFVMTTTDTFYLVSRHRFATRYFYFATPSTGSRTLTVQYLSGESGTWTAVEDLIDETIGFTQSGFISWAIPDENAPDWLYTKAASPITALASEELYYLRIKVSGNCSAGTSLQAVLNLFSNDTMLAVFYPELVSDTRWLPSGQTNFVPQHNAAKNLVVTRLIQKKVIQGEQHIIDISELHAAACHACAYLILAPLARDEATTIQKNSALSAMEAEISQANFSIDSNEDGIVSIVEDRKPYTFLMKR